MKRHPRHFLAYFFLLLIFVAGIPFSLFSQQTGRAGANDSLSATQIRKLMERDMQHQFEEYLENRKLNNQRNRLRELVGFISRVDIFLRRGIDTTRIQNELQKIEASYLQTTASLRADTSHYVSLREFNSGSLLLHELLKSLHVGHMVVHNYSNTLSKMQFTIDSMATDSAIYVLPKDSKKFESVMLMLTESSRKTKPVIKQLDRAKSSIARLNLEMSKLKNEMEITLHELENGRKSLILGIYNQDYPFLWIGVPFTETIMPTLRLSIYRAQQTINYYLSNNVLSATILIVSTLLIYYLINSSALRIKKYAGTNPLLTENPAFRFPARSSLLLAFAIGQFVFISAPFSVCALFWSSFVLLLVAIALESVEFIDLKNAASIAILTIIAIILNLSLFPHQYERWIIVTTSSLSMVNLWKIQESIESKVPRQRLVRIIMLVTICFEAIAFIAIIFGRFNLGKTLLSSGILLVAGAFVLVIAETILDQAFELYIGSLTSDQHRVFKHKLKQFHAELKSILPFAVCLGVLTLFYRNFFLSGFISNTLSTRLTQEIAIGELTFSLVDILSFAAILFATGWTSRTIAFVFAGTETNAQYQGKWSAFRNWSVVFRLFIIIIGGLLAFLVVGIPMDRITIIIGALGVGIGFGFQGIANNILSGIILVIEKPVKIGDQVDVSGRIGKIHSVGIRSTTLLSIDGSEVVIPNSDIINQHLVNWTMSNSKRRIEVTFSAEYSADQSRIKQVVEEVVRKNSRIDPYPKPLVLLHSFDESAISFRVLFWTEVDTWLEVKSEVILAIHQEFGQQGITIPFPQLNLHIDKI